MILLGKRPFIRVFFAVAVLVLFGQAATVQAQPAVLAELFRNINCGNCRVPDDNYAKYLAKHPNVVLINYHNSTTDVKDPFYVASKASSDARELDLNGAQLSDPSAYIDGASAQPGGTAANEATWEQYSNAGLSQPLAPITVTGSTNAAGIVVRYTTPAVGQAFVKVFVVLKESSIHYVNTLLYGATPGDLWDDVMRIVLPTPTGSTPFSVATAHSDSVVYKTSDHPDWNLKNMTAVVFAEDASGATHQIFGLGVLPLAQFAAVHGQSASMNKLLVSASPANAETHFRIELAQAATTRIMISDALGREVRSLPEMELSAGETTIPAALQGLTAGSYFVRLIVGGADAGQTKVIYAP